MTICQERNDLHLTSTGVGHQFKEPLSFPPINFQRSVVNSLPRPLSHGDQVQDFYKTTTGSYHNYKPTQSALSNEIYKKAPAHYCVDYTEDTIKKLHVKPQRQPLTMGNQASEMKSQYTGREGISLDTEFSNDVQPKNFRHHHVEGPVKQLVPSTCNKELAGDTYHVQDRGVLSYHGDMYLTTTQKDHRAFKKQELSQYPRKDYGTYWECEGYPKAWGHGSKTNPLPPDSVPRESGPMRDPIWFKSATMIPRLPKSMQCVRNKGMCSEVRANFTSPSDEKRKVLFESSVSTPWEIKGPGPEEIFSIPKMYESEYQFYGGTRPVMV